MAPRTKAGGLAGWMKLFAWVVGVLVPLFYVLDQNLQRFYIFDPEALHDLSRRAIEVHGNDTKAIAGYIITELKGQLPMHVNDNFENTGEWFFNNAGGAMGNMFVIHASVTEYLIIFGTPLGTEGHTGRHTADDYFNILTGTQLAFPAGAFEPEVYPPGSVHHLRRWTVKQYKMPENCFALEYARGWIPPMLFFGFADTLSSTLDLPTLWTTTWITGREMIGNLVRLKF